MILDLVEVAKLHTGVNLGTAFVNVLESFGVDEKVRALYGHQRMSLTRNMYPRYSVSLLTMHRTMIQ